MNRTVITLYTALIARRLTVIWWCPSTRWALDPQEGRGGSWAFRHGGGRDAASLRRFAFTEGNSMYRCCGSCPSSDPRHGIIGALKGIYLLTLIWNYDIIGYCMILVMMQVFSCDRDPTQKTPAFTKSGSSRSRPLYWDNLWTHPAETTRFTPNQPPLDCCRCDSVFSQDSIPDSLILVQFVPLNIEVVLDVLQDVSGHLPQPFGFSTEWWTSQTSCYCRHRSLARAIGGFLHRWVVKQQTFRSEHAVPRQRVAQLIRESSGQGTGFFPARCGGDRGLSHKVQNGPWRMEHESSRFLSLSLLYDVMWPCVTRKLSL